MNVVYLILWGLLAVYCFCMAHKISPILYLGGVFFIFMLGWRIADLVIEVDMFAGTLGWIFKGISVVFLIALLVFYFIIRKKQDS